MDVDEAAAAAKEEKQSDVPSPASASDSSCRRIGSPPASTSDSSRRIGSLPGSATLSAAAATDYACPQCTYKSTVASETARHYRESHILNSAPLPTNVVVEAKRAKALFDFEAAEDNELPLKAGDICKPYSLS